MGFGEWAILAVLAVGLVACIVERVELNRRRAQRERVR